MGEQQRSDCFASFFAEKVETITRETIVDPGVYNGDKKIESSNQMFMSPSEIKVCIEKIKIKNCEGSDRIPQRVIIEGMVHLLNPLSKLFNAIYLTKKIPEQWLIGQEIALAKGA